MSVCRLFLRIAWAQHWAPPNATKTKPESSLPGVCRVSVACLSRLGGVLGLVLVGHGLFLGEI